MSFNAFPLKHFYSHCNKERKELDLMLFLLFMSSFMSLCLVDVVYMLLCVVSFICCFCWHHVVFLLADIEVPLWSGRIIRGLK